MADTSDSWTLTLDEPDRYGREQVRTVNLTIDIRDFKDRAGFAWLVLAANPHLSRRDIQDVLVNVGEQHFRPAGWISRHWWLFHGTGKTGAKRNADGQDERARKIMAEHTHLTSRALSRLLKDEYGINRSKDWVRKNRVSGY